MTADVDQANVALDLALAGTGLFMAAWLSCGLVGAALNRRRNRSVVAGAALGLLLGPLGWLIIMVRGERIAASPALGTPVGDAVEAAGRHASAVANKVTGLAGRGSRPPGDIGDVPTTNPDDDPINGWELDVD
jgi:hypothetical protein